MSLNRRVLQFVGCNLVAVAIAAVALIGCTQYDPPTNIDEPAASSGTKESADEPNMRETESLEPKTPQSATTPTNDTPAPHIPGQVVTLPAESMLTEEIDEFAEEEREEFDIDVKVIAPEVIPAVEPEAAPDE